ncbi:bacteriocin immunity protein [Nocardia sp. NPDC057668]|uniref:bacteriocin immunity protein n=1 Tax=Nocardia sp. NPDC057668 TaxID=3346202 RepID=UPI00366A7213
MDLRPELLPPSVTRTRLSELGTQIERIADLIISGAPAEEAVATFNAETGHSYTPLDFIGYHGARDLDDFAREAARPAWPRFPDITREELVAVVERILAADPETDYYLLVFTTNVPHPRAADLIYHPEPGLAELSAESVVDAALKYRPIEL